jgi:mono/diheme cytochrome c family protein
MWIRAFCLMMLALCLPVAGWAEDRLVRLYASPALVETGVLKYALPRFSLKTQVRVTLAETPSEADLLIHDQGSALFHGAGQIWRLEQRRDGHLGTDRLAAWLTSEVGQRTVLAYAPDGETLFTVPASEAATTAELSFDGDPVLGKRVSQERCIRCHVVDDDVRRGIGSTPSFAVLRSLDDWEERFSVFYVLNPHPSFTQIADVSAPFDPNRPSPIVPVELTLTEVEAIVAYVAGIAPADLGAPLAHQ